MGDHSNHSISNFFINFRKHHLRTNAHIRSLCRHQGLPYSDHPQFVAPKGKPLILSSADHKRLAQERTQIVEDVNDTVDIIDGKETYYIVGDLDSNGFMYHFYWFKVRCRFCGDFFQLYPTKKNLLVNLQNYL
jgi:hypothetical protein